MTRDLTERGGSSRRRGPPRSGRSRPGRAPSRRRSAVQLRDEFISVAAHELRTPLTALQLKIQGLDRTLAQGDRGNARRAGHPPPRGCLAASEATDPAGRGPARRLPDRRRSPLPRSRPDRPRGAGRPRWWTTSASQRGERVRSCAAGGARRRSLGPGPARAGDASTSSPTPSSTGRESPSTSRWRPSPAGRRLTVADRGLGIAAEDWSASSVDSCGLFPRASTVGSAWGCT